VVKWWKPIALEYKENILKLIKTLPKLKNTKYKGSIILKFVEMKWIEYLN